MDIFNQYNPALKFGHVGTAIQSGQENKGLSLPCRRGHGLIFIYILMAIQPGILCVCVCLCVEWKKSWTHSCQYTHFTLYIKSSCPDNCGVLLWKRRTWWQQLHSLMRYTHTYTHLSHCMVFVSCFCDFVSSQIPFVNTDRTQLYRIHIQVML